MREPKPIAGARALLFERLVDLNPGSQDDGLRPFRVLNREQLKESVRRELQQLLNTRCSLPLHQLAEEERSVINYGIPDFSSLSAEDADAQELIASVVSRSIAAYEPRLKQIRVTVERSPDNEWGLGLNIEALLVIDLFTEPVSFPVLLNSKSGAAEVHDSQ
jgi:type VI secretion system lysozyme-like protein